mmetsp:Transcript_21630/g.35694  ORF Transcript_21630/g.35694 Transcript_21630/m.35694 type:complete len:285 (+) Transcript_21630:81-935(+)
MKLGARGLKSRPEPPGDTGTSRQPVELVQGAEAELVPLCRAVTEAFDELKHQCLLRSLWRTISPEVEFCRCSWRWLRLGFQGDNPTDDLRGVGALGLKQLVHFLESGAGHVVLRQNDAVTVPFPLAAASFNVTHLLTVFLQLSSAPAPGPRCSDATYCLIARLAAVSFPQFLDLIHAEVLRALADRWFRMQTPSSICAVPRTITIMHFPSVLEVISTRTREALTIAPSRSFTLPDFLLQLRAALRDPDWRITAFSGKSTSSCTTQVVPTLVALLAFAGVPTADA